MNLSQPIASDRELLVEDYELVARSALAQSSIRSIRSLEVRREDDALVLEGVVSTFYYKQLAQELVRAVAGPLRVVNRIAVP